MVADPTCVRVWCNGKMGNPFEKCLGPPLQRGFAVCVRFEINENTTRWSQSCVDNWFNYTSSQWKRPSSQLLPLVRARVLRQPFFLSTNCPAGRILTRTHIFTRARTSTSWRTVFSKWGALSVCVQKGFQAAKSLTRRAVIIQLASEIIYAIFCIPALTQNVSSLLFVVLLLLWLQFIDLTHTRA
jgi:hypothetical protein